MQELMIQAEPRQTGKGTSRKLRKERFVPAVIYGPKTEPMSISVSELDAVRYSRTGFENTIFTIQSKDSKLNGMKILRKAIDIHPVSRRPVHMDFFAPDMTQKVRVHVEVRITGKARGIADGGLVSMVRRDVEIECLPLEIPPYFELDVTDLELNASMHVSDIKFPENVRVITSMEETIVSCAEVKEEELAPAGEAAAAAEGAATPAAGDAAAAAPAPEKK